jgi:predicted small secreted protein
METTMTKRSGTLILLIGILASLSLAACNTVEGAGKDTKSVGSAVERAADQNK